MSAQQVSNSNSNTSNEEETGQPKVWEVEFTDGQPFECSTLKKPKRKEGFKKLANQKTYEISCQYNFDITKANKIFAQLFDVGQLKLLGNYKLPSAEEFARK